MSGFSSLDVGVRALFAAQRALDVTGHNVSNANTDGYSRERVQQEANSGPITPAMYARWTGAGDGVTVTGIERIRDDFLQVRAQQEHATQGALTQSQRTLSDVEMVFGEPSDSGLQQQMADFWSGWDDVANNPGDLAARSQLIERASTLAEGFNGASRQLATQWSSSRTQIDALVSDINTTATNIANLNQSIKTMINAGQSPNDLQDQRDQLVLGLSSKVGAVAVAHDDGTVDVTIGGGALVSGTTVQQLAVTGPSSFPGSPDSVDVVWQKDGFPAAVASGQLAGLVSAVNSVIPSYVGKLDQVAQQLATTVNAQHASGYDLNGAAGGNFFTSGATVTAANISVQITDPAQVAASSTAPPVLDGNNALTMAEHSGDLGGPDASYRQLVTDLGVQAQSANRRVTIQDAITSQVDDARQSVSSVNIDEEMTNLLNYQHAYQAAARFISTIDSTLDTLINHMGIG